MSATDRPRYSSSAGQDLATAVLRQLRLQPQAATAHSTTGVAESDLTVLQRHLEGEDWMVTRTDGALVVEPMD